VFASLASAASWLLQLAQQPAEGINLAFVSEFLAFGKLDQFQNLLHLIERLPQRFNNLRHFAHRLADGGIVRLGGAWRGNGGMKLLPGRRGWGRKLGRAGSRRGRRRRRFNLRQLLRNRNRRQGTAASASTTMPAAAADARFPGWRMAICFGS